MPKFGAHILIAEAALQRRPDLFDGATNALRLGGIGPDVTLFLFDPVTNPTARKGYEAAVWVMKQIHDIKSRLKQIETIFDGPAQDLQDWVTGHMSVDFSETVELLLEATLLAAKLGMANGASSINIQNPLARAIASGQLPPHLIKNPAHAVPSFLIDSADNYGFPLRYFGHPLTDDGKWKSPEPTGNYAKWWWMDMLHYRKTGTFAKALINNATDALTRDYARGYLSHVAGDICGHPFINGLVGGPFRDHAYRHMVLESLADTLLWRTQQRGDILSSDLSSLVALSDGELTNIADLLIKSMRQIYVDPMLPNQLPGRYPEREEIIAAYRSMTIYLELSTTGNVGRPKPPPNNPGDLIKEIQNLLARNYPGAPPNWDPSDPLNSIIAILGWLFRGAVFLLMIATLPHAVLMRFLASAPRWLLYLIKLAIFMMVSGLRTLLAFMGWGYAGADDFDTFGFLSDMVTYRGIEGDYPRSGVTRPKPPYYWMIPPFYVAPSEPMRTIAGPMPKDSNLDWVLDQNNRYDEASVSEFIAAADSRSTFDVEQRTVHKGISAFGNAPDFCNLMLDGSAGIPDLDLDGDRGFGFKPWEELPPQERYV